MPAARPLRPRQQLLGAGTPQTSCHGSRSTGQTLFLTWCHRETLCQQVLSPARHALAAPTSAASILFSFCLQAAVTKLIEANRLPHLLFYGSLPCLRVYQALTLISSTFALA